MNAGGVAPSLSSSMAQTKAYVYDRFRLKPMQNQALSRLCVWLKPYKPHRK